MTILAGYQDQGKRKEQQDSYGSFESKDKSFEEHAGKLAIVADGMGGLAQGKEASSLAIKKFIESYKQKKREEGIASALLRSMHYCNKAVYEFSESQGMDGKIGTTLVAAVLQGNNLYWISVGDSRIYLQQQGQLSLLTTDHSYESKLAELVAQGKISKEDADSHPQKASLTSYIGAEEIEIVDRNTSPLKCFKSNKILLCSDGLYSRLTHEDISALMNANPLTGCKNLVAKKLSMNIKKQDNLTAVIMEQGNISNGSRNMPSTNNNSLIFISFIIIAAAIYMYFKPEEDLNSLSSTKEVEVLSETKIDSNKEAIVINSETVTKIPENKSATTIVEASPTIAEDSETVEDQGVEEVEVITKEKLNLNMPNDSRDITPNRTTKNIEENNTDQKVKMDSVEIISETPVEADPVEKEQVPTEEAPTKEDSTNSLSKDKNDKNCFMPEYGPEICEPEEDPLEALVNDKDKVFKAADVEYKDLTLINNQAEEESAETSVYDVVKEEKVKTN
tara:strand:+ start:8009 stop:9526 length:1518 start_codon:yes stop_codon:yes gene_type:complete